MQIDPFQSPEPENPSFLDILGKLFGAAGTAAVVALVSMSRLTTAANRHQIPMFVLGFAVVGFCAGLILVLNDAAQKGIERSRNRERSTVGWKLLRFFALLLILPVVIGFCILILLCGGG